MMDGAREVKWIIVASLLTIVLCAHGAEPTAPLPLFGHYNGTYDPAADAPPAGNTRWIKVEGFDCSIEPNTPSPGMALFTDDALQGGSYFNMKMLLGYFGGTLEDTEYEFTMRLAIHAAGTATLPNCQIGFRDEGGEGRCVVLAWYRAADDDFLLAFMNAAGAGPLMPVSYLNWMDGKMREYTVKKYRLPESGEMVVQVLIDGQPQFREPVPYARFPLDLGNDQGFQFGSSSATKGRYLVDDIRFGPLNGIPPVAEVSAADELADTGKTITPIPGPWKLKRSADTPREALEKANGEVQIPVDGTSTASSAAMRLKPNRVYSVRGTAAVTGEVDAVYIEFEQFRGAYTVNVPPHQRHSLTLPAGGGEVTFDFPAYMRMENDRVRVVISAEGRGGSVRVRDLSLTGGGHYRPGLKLFAQEEPLYDNAAIAAEAAERTMPDARVTNHNGFLTFQVDGQVEPPVFYLSPMKSSRETGWWGAFGRVGSHLHSIHPRRPSDSAPFWQAKGVYDFQSIEDSLKMVLSRDKDARIILGVWVDPYDEWGLENPDEVCQNQAGLYAIGVNHFSRWVKEPGNHRLLPSIFSQKASLEIVDMFTALEGWLDSHDIGKTVVGYYVGGFNDADFGHWVHPGTSAGEKEPDDYSPAALAAWRQWLREYYEGDRDRLRASWGRQDADFDTVALPSPERRRAKGGDGFPWLLNPSDREIVDFNRFYGEAPARFIADIVSGVRQRTGTPRMIMLHQGNVMRGWRGYTGFGAISRVSGLDAIAATSDYRLRFPGYPGGCDSLPESLALQGKLFLHEFDYRSHCYPTQFENFDFVVGRSSDAAMNRTMMWREGINMIARGAGMYCYDMEGAWYADPEIFVGVKGLLDLYKEQLQLPGPARADVAYFLGEDSANYLGDSEEASRFLMRVTRRHRPQWDTSGVPYRLYLQRDIANPALPNYKVYVFLMPQKITTPERQAVEALKRDGHTLVFLHAPGICDNGDEEATIEAVTGMRATRILGSEIALAGTWLATDNPLLAELAGPFGDRPIPWAFSDRESRGLAFAIDDPETTPLAHYRDNPDAVAAAVRDFVAWRSIYVAVPWLDAQFISNIARAAGAWRAVEPHDAVYANQHFIGIHTMAAGKKVLRPHQKSRVTDALTGERVAEGVAEFVVDLPFGVTRVFRTEAVE